MLHPSHALSCSLLPEGTHCHMAFNKSHCSSRSPKYLSVCLQLPLDKWIFDRIWKRLVGMTPNMVIKTLFMNLAVLRPIFGTILSFILSVLSDTVYDLCPPEPLWHGATSISLFPSISSSVVLSHLLVWHSPWLPAGLRSTAVTQGYISKVLATGADLSPYLGPFVPGPAQQGPWWWYELMQ